MKDLYHFLKDMGVFIEFMLAGLFGGFVFVSKESELTFFQKFSTVIAGAVTANYVTPLAIYYTGAPNRVHFAIAFLLGYTGIRSIEFIIKNYESYKQNKSQNSKKR